MKEYIERTSVLSYPIRKDHCDKEHANEHFIFGIESVMEYVENIPAADVVEVRHGRWIPEACESVSKRNRLIEYRVYSCSICGRSNGRVKKRYCPNCGALMDKEADHD